jgi:STE24 endopeptidase
LKGFAFVNNVVLQITDNYILQTLLFFGICYAATFILSLPFTIYETFVIEKKYGFNTTTPRIFIMDILKSLLLTILISGGLLALIVYIYTLTSTWFWLLAWFSLAAFSLFMGVFYSTLIVPLFNKQAPLEEGELKTAIMNFAEKTGFNISNIFVIDGSKRSTKANAYFTGLGKRKRVVLYDTLIQEMSVDEIVAVLAHEIGHYKKKHILYSLILSTFTTGLMLFLLSVVINNPVLYKALGSEHSSFQLGLIVFGILYSPLSLVIGLVANYFSRKNEFAADRFAKENFEAASLASALKKLSVKNLSNMMPHPAYVFFHYSHPPLLERLEKIES